MPMQDKALGKDTKDAEKKSSENRGARSSMQRRFGFTLALVGAPALILAAS